MVEVERFDLLGRGIQALGVLDAMQGELAQVRVAIDAGDQVADGVA